MTPGRTSYHLRRLRLRGLIERQPHTNRYRITSEVLRTALFCTRTYSRLLRPGLTALTASTPDGMLSRLFTTWRQPLTKVQPPPTSLRRET